MKLFRVIVPVTNMAQGVAFYRIVFDQPGRPVSAGRHYFDCEGTVVACVDGVADGDGVRARPHEEPLYFAVDDVHASFEALLRAGARMMPGDVDGTPAGAVADRPWGERSVYCEDPFGNALCFVERSTTFVGG